MITHFRQHQEKDASMSVLEFLYIHYKPDTAKDEDYLEDMKLPFKTNDIPSSQIDFAFYSVDRMEPEKLIVQRIEKKEQFIDKDQLPGSLWLSSIWQPPKTA